MDAESYSIYVPSDRSQRVTRHHCDIVCEDPGNGICKSQGVVSFTKSYWDFLGAVVVFCLCCIQRLTLVDICYSS